MLWKFAERLTTKGAVAETPVQTAAAKDRDTTEERDREEQREEEASQATTQKEGKAGGSGFLNAGSSFN